MAGSVKGKKQNGGGRPSEKSQTKPKGEQSPPVKPDDLIGVYANQLWDEAVKSLEHVLRPIDFAILRLACHAFETAMTDEDPKVRLSAQRVFESHGRQIGLTPSSRRIVKPVDAVEETDTEFDDWLKRGGMN